MSVVVVGLGVMGAQTLLHLARSGVDCVGVERHGVPHEHGASGGGATRIFRSGWDPTEARRLDYARAVWQELRLDGEPVFVPCGALTVGRPEDPRMTGPLEFAHRSPGRFTLLDARSARERWPRLLLEPDEVSILDRGGGLLRAGPGLAATVTEARAHGARVVTHTSVTRLMPVGGLVEASTATRPIRAERAVVTVGRVPSTLMSGWDATWPTVRSRRVVLVWKPWEGEGPTEEYPPPGLRYLQDGASISFFPPVDGWGPKFNYISTDRPLADGTPHPGVHASDVRTTDQQASSTIESMPGIARLETYVEHYAEPSGSPHLVSGPQVTWASGFSGVGYRSAPWIGRELAARASAGLTR